MHNGDPLINCAAREELCNKILQAILKSERNRQDIKITLKYLGPVTTLRIRKIKPKK